MWIEFPYLILWTRVLHEDSLSYQYIFGHIKLLCRWSLLEESGWFVNLSTIAHIESYPFLFLVRGNSTTKSIFTLFYFHFGKESSWSNLKGFWCSISPVGTLDTLSQILQFFSSSRSTLYFLQILIHFGWTRVNRVS